MNDETAAVKEIMSLSLNARNLLSHILRNGLMGVIAANMRNNPDVDKAVISMEKAIRRIGL